MKKYILFALAFAFISSTAFCGELPTFSINKNDIKSLDIVAKPNLPTSITIFLSEDKIKEFGKFTSDNLNKQISFIVLGEEIATPIINDIIKGNPLTFSDPNTEKYIHILSTFTKKAN